MTQLDLGFAPRRRFNERVQPGQCIRLWNCLLARNCYAENCALCAVCDRELMLQAQRRPVRLVMERKNA